MDLRLGEDGTLHVLELNAIAGIDPSYLLPRAAAAGGYAYPALVKRILDLALARGSRLDECGVACYCRSSYHQPIVF